MKSKALKRAMIGAVAMLTALLAGTVQAGLESRDLNGDTVTDAFYDRDLNITWLRDANVNGRMVWDDAFVWADNFSFAGYNDWRLPTSDTCTTSGCTGSEMGHLWYTELGNSGGTMTNTGDFQNLQSYAYWSGTEWALGPTYIAWTFYTAYGYQDFVAKSSLLYAFAVRSGDVAAVPESQTYVLLVVGLSVIGFIARRRRNKG